MNHEALPTAEDDYVERLFKVMRGYDCFFPFSDEDLRGMIRDWLRAAADLSMDVLGRLDGLTFYLHEDVNSLEDDDPVRLVFPMSIGNNVYGHRASQGDNGICHDENAAPPAAGQASAVRELVAVVRDHVAALQSRIAELERGIVHRGDDVVVPLALFDEINRVSYEWQQKAAELERDAARWRWTSERAWFVDAAAYAFDLRFGPGDFTTEPRNADSDDVCKAIDEAMAEDEDAAALHGQGESNG